MSPSKPLLNDQEGGALSSLPSHKAPQAGQGPFKPEDEDDAETWATASIADSLSPDYAPFPNGGKSVSSPSSNDAVTATTTGVLGKEDPSSAPTLANGHRKSASLKNYLHRTARSENMEATVNKENESTGKQNTNQNSDSNGPTNESGEDNNDDDDGSWLIEGESAEDEDEDREEAAAQLLGQQLHHMRKPSTIAEESTHVEADDAEDGIAERIQPLQHGEIPPSTADSHVQEASPSDVSPLSFPRKTASMSDLQSTNTTERSKPTSIFLSPLHSPQIAATTTTRTAATPATTSSDSGGVHPTQISVLSQQKLQMPNDLSSDRPARVVLPMKPIKRPDATNNKTSSTNFEPYYGITKYLQGVSTKFFRPHYTEPLAAATWIGFWALLHVTCANYVLTPMRDAIALAVGVDYMPKLTLASTLMALCSSVPIGWLFEAPDPNRRRLWKRMGLTRGETQGTSLALFYRFFALILLSYAVGFPLIEWLISHPENAVGAEEQQHISSGSERGEFSSIRLSAVSWLRSHIPNVSTVLALIGQSLYIAFFLVVHLMKLHSLSLVWGVTSEAMEYEDVARKKATDGGIPNTGDIMADSASPSPGSKAPTRYQRLALIGFGGTLGGILGSMLASSLAQILYLPGLLVLAAVLLEVSAQLSIELGRIMEKHWREQQLFQSTNDLGSLVDTSMRRSVSLGSMKRIGSGNSLNRLRAGSDSKSPFPSPAVSPRGSETSSTANEEAGDAAKEDTFVQRLLRGVKTIFSSRLLMAIFTYNALYASTTVLLSFQRAALVANRNETTSKEADMAFLANINMASSVAIFALQASGAGAFAAQTCGPQGTLALMPLIRLAGVLALAWWHHTSDGKPPNLMVFLVVDECCKIMNLAVAKPVRESLWRGLSNEARYEAKPIVDTLANRWGGGSAAFLVSTLNKTLDLFGVPVAADGSRMVFGYPPVLFLCMIISAWWSVVSADLGQIRKRIDVELKKRQ